MAKRMIWVTVKRAEKAASIGLKAATQSSWDKWNNYATCTKLQLDKKLKSIGFGMYEVQECALCLYFRGCLDCFLHRRGKSTRDCYSKRSLYAKAIKGDLAAYRESPTLANFESFQKAARVLADEIKKKGKL